MLKDEKIQIRCSKEFKEELKNKASRLNISMSDLLVYCYREGTSYDKLRKVLGRND